MNILLLNAGSSSLKAVLSAVGHRVVHGGPFTSSVRITPAIRSRIMELADATCRPDADVATHGSHGRIYIIATREDVTMRNEVLLVLRALDNRTR